LLNGGYMCVRGVEQADDDEAVSITAVKTVAGIY